MTTVTVSGFKIRRKDYTVRMYGTHCIRLQKMEGFTFVEMQIFSNFRPTDQAKKLTDKKKFCSIMNFTMSQIFRFSKCLIVDLYDVLCFSCNSVSTSKDKTM